MKNSALYAVIIISLFGCTTARELTYFGNIDDKTPVEYFQSAPPEYKLQYRDNLYIEIKTLTSVGQIGNVLQGSSTTSQTIAQGEVSQYLMGYSVDKEGNILLPVLGKIEVAGKTIDDVRSLIQKEVDIVYRNSYVEVKLLSFKFTVIGEANAPGTYFNYNNYLTVLEAIGRAGGVNDYGRRDRVLVIRTTGNETKTFRLNLRDKNILTSEGYFLMPNDVLIIEPAGKKAVNLNLPLISLTISSITGIVTTTLLLINYFGK